MSQINKSLDKLSENMDVTSSQEEVIQSSTKLWSHSCAKKSKKHRRGKKRKKTNFDDNNSNDRNETLKSLDPNYVKKRRRSIILIRPENVPKAPQNSTQFIIDDHEDCKMYFSFDYHKPKTNNSSSTAIRATFSPKANENYEIYDSEETSQFYLNDFEMAFNRARFDELMKKDRNELVDMCQRLENTVTALQRNLLFINPSEVLDELQDQLIGLQEENKILRQKNRKLKQCVNQKTCSNSYPNSSNDDENDSGNVMHCDDHFSDDDHRSHDCSSCTSDSDSSSSSSSTTATHSSNDKFMSETIDDNSIDNSYKQIISV